MKIGLITIYHVPNYGSVFQAYATQRVFENLGVECAVINYKYPNEWHFRHGAKKPTTWRTIYRKIFPTRKVASLNKFKSSYFHFTRSFASLEDLSSNSWSDFDALVVGSDQVWNYRFVHGDSTFMLSFAPDDKPKYSLASSFAQNSLPDDVLNTYRKYLSKFSALSVREQNGVDLINNQLGINKNVEIILDPTLLLSKQEWLSTIPRSKFKNKRPYILLYMLYYAFEPRPYIFEVIKHFQQKMDCDVISLAGYTTIERALGIEMINMNSATVPEFIDLYNNASLVITSSFHGTAFALNFGIPLISVVSDCDGDDRQSSLLRSVGAEKCITHIGLDVNYISPEYDHRIINTNLYSIRSSNIEWIKTNILCKSES